MDHPLRTNLAKWAGVLSSAAVLVLWLGVISVKQGQSDAQSLPEGSWQVGRWVIDSIDRKMMLLAGLGAAASGLRLPVLMLAVFGLMFLPAGLYTLGLPGWARFIGIANLLFLLAGAVMLTTRRTRSRAGKIS